MSSKLPAFGLAFALLGGAMPLLCGCGKSTKASSASSADAGPARLVASPPPAAVASSPWLEKKTNGTYAIVPDAECIEVLASSPPELTIAPLGAARGVRATLPAKDTVMIPSLHLRAKLPPGSSGPSWARVAPAGIEVVRQSEREWESAYADLLELALPFDALLLHSSETPWGEGTEVAALSTRLYAVAASVEETWENLRTRLPAVGARVACKNRHGASSLREPLSTVTTGERGPWKTVRTTMSVWYGDYGGVAEVELFVRRVEAVTIVLAFMFEGESRANERNAFADALAKP